LIPDLDIFGIYQPDEAQQARIAEAKECKKLKVDRRKADDFVRWLRHRVEEGKRRRWSN